MPSTLNVTILALSVHCCACRNGMDLRPEHWQGWASAHHLPRVTAFSWQLGDGRPRFTSNG